MSRGSRTVMMQPTPWVSARSGWSIGTPSTMRRTRGIDQATRSPGWVIGEREMGEAMRGHDIVAKALVDEGIDTVFGLIGDANLFIADCLVRQHGVRYVAATHEAAVTLMALGYARASGQVGVGTITHGPALTNAMTALVEGVRSRTPLLLVAGDTDPADPHHLQNIDQRALVEATGAGFEPIRSTATIAADVATAMRRARVEGCPVVLDMGVDIEALDVDYVPAPAVAEAALPTPDAEALDRAVGIIASASRPIVLA